MNKIDRRFLKNTSIYVNSISRTTPPSSATAGYRCIVKGGATEGGFLGVLANAIAYYDGTNWTFSMPEVSDILLYENSIYQFDGTEWKEIRHFGDTWAPVFEAICKAGVGETLPDTASVGDRYLYFKEGEAPKIYTRQIGAWDNGVSLKVNKIYLDKNGNYYKFSNVGQDWVQKENGDFDYISEYEILYVAMDNALYIYTGSSFVKITNDNDFDNKALPPVLDIVKTGTTLPSTAEVGEKFLNTSTRQMFTATAVNTWGTGVTATNGYYASSTDKCIYNKGSSDITCIVVPYGGMFFNKADRFVYVLDTEFVKASFDGEVIPEAVTETHVLTAEEVTAKSFTLTNSVKTGKETNILCFVQGVAQAADIAFSVSGSTFGWADKTLEGNLSAGDVFIVHYVKA